MSADISAFESKVESRAMSPRSSIHSNVMDSLLSSRGQIKKLVKHAIGQKLNDYLSLNDSVANGKSSTTLAQRMDDVENKAKQRQFSIGTITHSELEKSGMDIKETMRQKKAFNESFMSAYSNVDGSNADMTIDQDQGVSRIHHKNDTTQNETM